MYFFINLLFYNETNHLNILKDHEKNRKFYEYWEYKISYSG